MGRVPRIATMEVDDAAFSVADGNVGSNNYDRHSGLLLGCVGTGAPGGATHP